MALTIVAPPERTSLTGGLFSVLTFPDSTARWEMGVTYPGQTCGTLAVSAGPGCTPDGQAEPDGWPIDLDREQPWGSADDTFTVSGSFVCNPVGTTLTEAEQFAVADLQRHEEATAEGELWARHLASAAPIGGAGPFKIKHAIGILEQYIGQTYGVQGVIHLPRWLAPSVGTAQRGGRLTTETLGTPIVAGSGYGIAGETVTIVATPAMIGYRTAAEVVGDLTDTFDRSTNQLQVLAQRTYLIGFDTCPPVSITVDPNL